eukprot:TRINITY_DN80527_c0_g1_i1.p1 TRINITY_DN80527_c0_g1~~TRINITY_DN80527_c0_g1_i1.p1  ORF type:complete len:229 (-),score=61.19 TRINITY_DN80527_c0_g1_i1:56-742(-)
MAAKRRLPLQLQKLSAEHLQKVRGHVQGLLAAGLQEIDDLNVLDDILAANLQGGAGSSPPPSPLVPGSWVLIGGLTGAKELNGQTGKILRLDDASGRYVVELSDGSSKSLKPDNLTVTERRSSSSAAASSPPRAKKGSKEQASSASPPCGSDGFKVGDRVRVGGLNGAIELNGQLAVVFSYDASVGRYLVEFENGAGQKKLQAKNLTGIGVATGPLAAKARMFAEMGS